MNPKSPSKVEKEILDLLSDNYAVDYTLKKRVSTLVESISDQNQFNKLDEVIKWFERKIENCTMEVEKIGLKDTKGWGRDEKAGDIVNDSGSFFSVVGVRVSNVGFRESGKGWDQPMFDQDWKSSVSGMLIKKFNNVNHYLVQAKAEPGNHPKLQFSPTLQATYSNLYKAHKGRKPNYAEYFENPAPDKVIYSQWLPEDGGRFLKKMVLNIIVDAGKDEEIEVKDDFIWLTLYQIKELLNRDYIINPHVRSLIASL